MNLGIGVHACYHRTQKARQEDCKFKVSLGYITNNKFETSKMLSKSKKKKVWGGGAGGGCVVDVVAQACNLSYLAGGD
jgi:hypothetical protein